MQQDFYTSTDSAITNWNDKKDPCKKGKQPLMKDNFLGEFRTHIEKTKVKKNLGIDRIQADLGSVQLMLDRTQIKLDKVENSVNNLTVNLNNKLDKIVHSTTEIFPKDEDTVYSIADIPNQYAAEFNGDYIIVQINGTRRSHRNSGSAMLVGDLTSCYEMFDGNDITDIDVSNLNTSNVTDMTRMFGSIILSDLDLSRLNVSNVETMEDMFYDCVNLVNLNIQGWDTSNLTNINYMFQNCDNLNSLILSDLNIDNVTTAIAMFSGCHKLEYLELGHKDFMNIQNMQDIFHGCYRLTHVGGDCHNINQNLSLQNSSLLTRQSCLTFINGLSLLPTSSKTITFHNDTKERLLPEDIAIASSKGWTIS